MQVYSALWGLERSSRRDFVLQTLAQHRRNLAEYLVANMLPPSVADVIRMSKRASRDISRSMGGGGTGSGRSHDPRESSFDPRSSVMDALSWSFSRVFLLQSDIVGFTKCAFPPRASPPPGRGAAHPPPPPPPPGVPACLGG